MFKPETHFFNQLRPVATKYSLRIKLTELARVGCCVWFALMYCMHKTVIKKKADLRKIAKRLKNPRHFMGENGLLQGVEEKDQAIICKMYGYILCDPLPKCSNSIPHLGNYLASMQEKETWNAGTRLLINVNLHAIALEVLPSKKLMLVDQVTSCMVDDMHANSWFGHWFSSQDFCVRPLQPEYAEPAARAFAFARQAEEADQLVSECVLELEASLRDKQELCERAPHGLRGLLLRHPSLRLRHILAHARTQARVKRLLARDVGAVFLPRAAAPAGSPRAQHPQQPLVLDHVRTERKVAKLIAAWEHAGTC